jgi:hypothetical protein
MSVVSTAIVREPELCLKECKLIKAPTNSEDYTWVDLLIAEGDLITFYTDSISFLTTEDINIFQIGVTNWKTSEVTGECSLLYLGWAADTISQSGESSKYRIAEKFVYKFLDVQSQKIMWINPISLRKRIADSSRRKYFEFVVTP